jgi:CBS domain-containing protein
MSWTAGRRGSRSTRDVAGGRLLVLSRASDLVVVDGEGRYVGVLAEGDLLHAG